MYAHNATALIWIMQITLAGNAILKFYSQNKTRQFWMEHWIAGQTIRHSKHRSAFLFVKTSRKNFRRQFNIQLNIVQQNQIPQQQLQKYEQTIRFCEQTLARFWTKNCPYNCFVYRTQQTPAQNNGISQG